MTPIPGASDSGKHERPAHAGPGDPLRQELRALGYLENPVGRFFAGGLYGARPALRTHLRVGCAVGVALGVLFAALSVPVVLATPGHLDPTLAVAIAALGFGLALMVGLAAAGGMFLVYRFTRRLAERADLVARSTGIAIFVLAFLYLSAFGWHYAAMLEAQWQAPKSLFAAAFGCAIALLAYLTARLFHLASFAVMAATGYEFHARPRGARRALALSLVGAASTAFVIVFLAPRTRTPEFQEHGEPLVVEQALAPQVVLLAIDGLDYDDATAAIAHGWVPNLARLSQQGFTSRLLADAADIPPAYWTTVTTGLATERHRIDSYYEHRVLGLSQATALGPSAGWIESVVALGRVLGLTEEVPVTASMSRLKRIVDVASESGLSTASFNFWASYPATTFGGTTISERAYLVLRAAEAHGAPLDPEVVSNCDLEGLKRFLHEPAEAAARLPAIQEFGLAGNRATTLPMLYDFFTQDAALEHLERQRPQFTQIGLTGLDILRYAYRNREAQETDVKFQAHGRVIEDAYRSLDRFVAALESRLGPDALLVIATCPGISVSRRDARGWLLVSGPVIAPRHGEDVVRPESIAPTVLFALGLPSSAELDGVVDRSWFLPEALGPAGRIPRQVGAFGQKPVVAKRDESSDETLRFLAEFGYLSASR